MGARLRELLESRCFGARRSGVQVGPQCLFVRVMHVMYQKTGVQMADQADSTLSPRKNNLPWGACDLPSSCPSVGKGTGSDSVCAGRLMATTGITQKGRDGGEVPPDTIWRPLNPQACVHCKHDGANNTNRTHANTWGVIQLI